MLGLELNTTIAAAGLSLGAGALVGGLMSAGEAARTEPGRVVACAAAGITDASEREGTCRTKSAVLTVANQGSRISVPGVSARVGEVVATPARTASGRQRHRVRLKLSLDVRNEGAKPMTPNPGGDGIYVSIAGTRVRADTAAAALAGAFDGTKPLAPGRTRTGFLRFELAGSAGRQVLETRNGALGLRAPAFTPDGLDRLGVVRFRATVADVDGPGL